MQRFYAPIGHSPWGGGACWRSSASPLAGQVRQAGASGTVTLSGVVGPDGTVQVVETTALTPKQRAITRHTLANVKTWRLEPAAREATFTLTVTFELDTSLAPYASTLRLALPHLTVRGNPGP